MSQSIRSTLVRAWLVTALADALFASTLSVVAYHSTAARIWQGVASTVLGPGALQGGARTVLIGLAMHVCVALVWTAVFLALVLAAEPLRRLITTPAGILVTAAVYGPLVWIVMSTLVIPTVTGRPPVIGARWWGQIAGHVFFVALPIVVMVARGLGATRATSRGAALEPAA